MTTKPLRENGTKQGEEKKKEAARSRQTKRRRRSEPKREEHEEEPQGRVLFDVIARAYAHSFFLITWCVCVFLRNNQPQEQQPQQQQQ